MIEIARRDGVGKQYVSRLIRLRFSHPSWWSGSLQAVNRPSLQRRHYGPAVLMFRWAGRRKSEPSDLRSRPEHGPCQQPDRRWRIYS